MTGKMEGHGGRPKWNQVSVMAHNPYVVVVGGANLDIAGKPTGPLVPRDSNLGTIRLSAGGVGRNIAHNLALLGVDVKLVTCFGEDPQADALIESCTEAGIDLAHAFAVRGGATSIYLYVTDETGEMQMAINDMAILEHLTPERLHERRKLIEGAAIVVVDTNLSTESLRWMAGHTKAPLFCDPISTMKAGKLEGLLGCLHTLKPNRLEAEALSGVDTSDEWGLSHAADELLATRLGRVFISLGADGLLCADHERSVRLPLLPCTVVNTTGAGDAMMAALVWSYLRGYGLEEAGLAGLAASAIAVESAETVNPLMSAEAVLARMALGAG